MISRRITTKEFIRRAREKHGDKYDYSKVEYVKQDEKVCIICPIHGEFYQRPSDHYRYDCKSCGNIKAGKMKIRYTKNNKKLHDYLKIPVGSKAIPLNGDHYMLVDEEDYNMLMEYNWSIAKRKYTSYAEHKLGKDTLFAHRFILGVTDPKIYVDHINHNGLDNRKCNLRLCNKSQNSANVGKVYKGTSKYKGVSKCPNSKNKWVAQIKKLEKYYFIGRSSNEEEAALAYNRKAVELFGEFAHLNIIFK